MGVKRIVNMENYNAVRNLIAIHTIETTERFVAKKILKSTSKALVKMSTVFDIATMIDNGELNPGGLFPFAFVSDSLVDDMNKTINGIVSMEVDENVNKGIESTEKYIDAYSFEGGLTENFEILKISDKTTGDLLLGKINDFEELEDQIFNEGDDVNKPNFVLFEFVEDSAIIRAVFIDESFKKNE